jgi:hypothetical protein
MEEVDRVADPNEKAILQAKMDTKWQNEYELDASKFRVFSRDMMRVDVGLIIQRPPIFVHMSDRDVEFLKLRSQLMNEYMFD